MIITLIPSIHLNQQPDYTNYHREVLRIEELIAEKQFEMALDAYDKLFDKYQFVFLREYKIAAQLAAHLGDEYRTFEYLGFGVASGWTLEGIKKHDKLKYLKRNPRWSDLELSYAALRQDYEYRINDSLRQVVKNLSKEDQKMAWNYLFRPSEKSKNKFIENVAIPISERHVNHLTNIIKTHGYPGEQIIGNSVWASTILGHHNSLSPEYQLADKLYPTLKPILLEAIKRGEMNPYDYAIIEDWYLSVKSDRQIKSYGIINPLTQEDFDRSNEMRSDLNIRSIELRNKLIEVEIMTGIDLHLGHGSWVRGKIIARD
ncbi:MAG: hypothetical protein CMP48_19960 [Rickettsiales bacterium]|nr:hypothetical protein [Rickettsiales bacterium]